MQQMAYNIRNEKERFYFMDRDTYTEVNGRLSPYCKHNGIFMTELAPGHGVAKKVVTEEDRNALGYAHGAVYFAVADTASGNAVAAYGHTTVTMNSDYHFMRSAKVGDTIIAEANVIKRGRTICVMDCTVKDQDGTLLGKGTFTFFVMEQTI